MRLCFCAVVMCLDAIVLDVLGVHDACIIAQCDYLYLFAVPTSFSKFTEEALSKNVNLKALNHIANPTDSASWLAAQQ